MVEIDALLTASIAAGVGYFFGLAKGAKNARDYGAKRLAEIFTGGFTRPMTRIIGNSAQHQVDLEQVILIAAQEFQDNGEKKLSTELREAVYSPRAFIEERMRSTDAPATAPPNLDSQNSSGND